MPTSLTKLTADIWGTTFPAEGGKKNKWLQQASAFPCLSVMKDKNLFIKTWEGNLLTDGHNFFFFFFFFERKRSLNSDQDEHIPAHLSLSLYRAPFQRFICLCMQIAHIQPQKPSAVTQIPSDVQLRVITCGSRPFNPRVNAESKRMSSNSATRTSPKRWNSKPISTHLQNHRPRHTCDK